MRLESTPPRSDIGELGGDAVQDRSLRPAVADCDICVVKTGQSSVDEVSFVVFFDSSKP